MDPFIGTLGDGGTFPGAVVPWGMVSVSPHTGTKEGAGYLHGRQSVLGFGHLHVSGSNPELGDFLVMPTTGGIVVGAERWFSPPDREQATPGYYRVTLARYGIGVEVTATSRVGLSRFTFPAGSKEANLLFDLSHSLGFGGNATVDSAVNVRSDSELDGWCKSGSFVGAGEPVTAYFTARLSRPTTDRGTWRGTKLGPEPVRRGTSIGAWFRYEGEPKAPLLMKLAVSYTSVENARRNLEAELPGWDFEAARGRAESLWAETLGRIRISGGSRPDRVKFYTALYHSLLHPNLLSDASGEYPAMNGGGVRRSTHDRYTVFSLWDTFRTLHPLLTLVYPERETDMLRSIVGMYEESGWLPLWELGGTEINSMIGDPAVSVLVDGYLKGVTGFDAPSAFQGMIKSATRAPDRPPGPGQSKGRSGIDAYLQFGYLPEDMPELKARPDQFEHLGVYGTVSTTLEYAYADWNIAQLARALGKTAEADRFLERASWYRNLYDRGATYQGMLGRVSGFFRPRNRDGSWHTPFPIEDFVPGRSPESTGFVEGGPWQYAFFVPHDIDGLKTLMGGDVPFAQKLDAFFASSNDPFFNEQTLAYPYLYNYVEGEAAKTQRLVREAARDRFTVEPDGLPGNDDTGALSAWLVFSAMGLYPACPGSPAYELGSPVFDDVRIRLGPDRELRVRAVHNGPGRVYVLGTTWNGRPHRSTQIDHAVLARGGSLVFRMSDAPGGRSRTPSRSPLRPARP